jgi:hypothetical protein
LTRAIGAFAARVTYAPAKERTMGHVNWIAVILAGNLAMAVGLVWYGPLFGGGRPLIQSRADGAAREPRAWGLVLGALLIAALMLGHNFARLGPDLMRAKPWLYFMMSGGIGLMFVAPALFIGLARHGVSRADRLRDCGFWIVAYLAMGAVFWALG